MERPWQTRFCLSFLIVALACREDVPSARTTQELSHLVIEDLVVTIATVPRFSGSSAGFTCPGEILPSGAPSPVCPKKRDSSQIDGGPELSIAVQQRIRVSRGSAGPEELRLQALWMLRWSRSAEGRDRAVDLYRLALDIEPRSAPLHNDLSAVLLLRSGIDDRAADLLDALGHAQLALEIDPNLLEARVNLAFALESFGLRREAAPIWRELADHAELGSLAGAFLTRPQPEASPALAETENLRQAGEEALGRWAMLQEAGATSVADHELATAGDLARRLGVRGDRILEEAVGVIERARRSVSPKRLRLLAAGHAGFARTQAASSGAARTQTLEKAVQDLDRADTPFHALAAIEVAIGAYFDRNLGEAEWLLARLADRWSSPSRLHLNGRLCWLRGLVAMRRGHFSTAADHYAQAVAIFEGLDEVGTVAYLRLLEATNDELVGDSATAWKKRLPALHQRFSIGDPIRIHTVVEETARAVERQAGPRVARFFLDEQVRAAQHARETAARPEDVLDLSAYALVDRAATRAVSGDPTGAAKDIDEAEVLWRQLPGLHENRERLRHDLDVARALHLGGDLSAIDAALRFFGDRDPATGDHFILVELHGARARRREELGDGVGAARDLERALRLVESQRWEVLDAQQRARYLAKMGELTESVVRLRLAAGQQEEALRAVERSENRILLDDAAGKPSLAFSLTLDDLRQAATDGSAVVRYGGLADRLLIWTIFDGRITFESQSIARQRLRQLVEGFRDAIRRQHPPEEIRQLGEPLAELLLPSALVDLPPETPLIVVPHGDLLGLPFSALVHRDQYLVERHPISFSPSLALLADVAGPESPAAEDQRVVIVADPAIDARRFAGLQRLPFAYRSAEEVSRLYPGRASVLTGSAATLERVLAALADARVFSYAGHTAIALPSGERGLVLAPGTGAGDRIFLTRESLSTQTFRDLKLVVLAACSSGPVNHPESSEMTGLVAGFLARGARNVVATAWDVDDEGSEAFALELHRQWRLLGRGELALRAAQLALLRDEAGRFSHPVFWAGFEIYRGKGRERPSQ